MKITDKAITATLRRGEKIKRDSSLFQINYYMDHGVLFKQTTNQGLRRLYCVAGLTIEDLEADDWRTDQ